MRDGLIAEYLGVPADRFSRSVVELGSLIGVIERLNDRSSRSLAEFPPPEPDQAFILAHDRFTDPERPPSQRIVETSVAISATPYQGRLYLG